MAGCVSGGGRGRARLDGASGKVCNPLLPCNACELRGKIVTVYVYVCVVLIFSQLLWTLSLTLHAEKFYVIFDH